MRRRTWIPALMIGVTLVAAITWLTRDSEPPPVAGWRWQGWQLAAGHVEAAADGGFETREATTLEREGDTLHLEPGARWSGVLAEGELPALAEGAAELRTRRPFRIAGESYRPAGVVRLRLGPDGVVILEGTLATAGRQFGPGQLWPPRVEIPVPPGGPELSDAIRPSWMVVDARDGHPVVGARVRVSFSHHEEGYPAHPAAEPFIGRTDAAGEVVVPAVRPDDPRLHALVQVDHPEFAPHVEPLSSARDTTGAWPAAVVRLRRALSAELHVQDANGTPLADTPFALIEDPADRFLGEDAWQEGRSARTGRWAVHHTDERGVLRVPLSPLSLCLLDPTHVLWDARLDEPTLVQPVHVRHDLARGLEPERWGVVHVRRVPHATFVLRDVERAPVPDALVEIAITLALTTPPELPPLRATTDAEGRFVLGARPYPSRLLAPEVREPRDALPRFERPCDQALAFGPEGSHPTDCFHAPRPARLTALAPRHWKQQADFVLSGVGDLVEIGRPLPELTFTLRSALAAPGGSGSNEGGAAGSTIMSRPGAPTGTTANPAAGSTPAGAATAPNTVPADDLRLAGAPGLTVVERTAAGFVRCIGAVPDGLTVLRVAVRGQRPTDAIVPAHVATARLVELGEVLLEPGPAVAIELAAASPTWLTRAEVRATPAFEPLLGQRVPAPADGRVRLAGLVPGVTYEISVEGPRLRPVRATVVADRALFDDGLVLPVVAAELEEVRLAGVAAQIAPEETPAYRVVERYFRVGLAPADLDPITCASYPLPPDGLFGSVRLLPPTVRAEVTVVGPFFRSWQRTVERRQGPGLDYDAGHLDPSASRHAILRVCGATPESVRDALQVVADRDRLEELVRVAVAQTRAGEGFVVLDGLRPSRYAVSWTLPGAGREDLQLDVAQTDQRLFIDVPCSGPDQVQWRVTVVDSQGTPRADATFESAVRVLPLERLTDSFDPLGVTPGFLALDPSAGATGPGGGGVPADLAGSAAGGSGLGDALAEGPNDAVFLIVAPRDQALSFSVSAPDLVTLAVEVPVGARVPARLVLETGLSIELRVLDAAGVGLTGELLADLSREEAVDDVPTGLRDGIGGSASGSASDRTFDRAVPARASDGASDGARGESAPPVRFSASARASVRGGHATMRLPAGRWQVRWRVVDSAAVAEETLDIESIARAPHPVRLREQRVLSGTVYLPNRVRMAIAEPAAGALVALVRRTESLRTPERPWGQRPGAVLFSTQADAAGRFTIDGLPLDLPDDAVLLAHLDGWTDAIEDPIDLRREERALVLDEPTELVLDLAQRDASLAVDYRFVLDHAADALAPGFVELGSILPTQGRVLHVGVTPGIYRVRWRHNDLPVQQAAAWPSVEATVHPGRRTILRLAIDEALVTGRALLNGVPFGDGWLLTTDDPGDALRLRGARVRDGEFAGPVAGDAGRLYATLVPAGSIERLPHLARGEALWQEVPMNRRPGGLVVQITAHDLDLVFPPDAIARFPGLAIELPAYTWTGQGFRATPEWHAVRENPHTLRLLPSGPLRLRATTGGHIRVTYEIPVGTVADFPIGL